MDFVNETLNINATLVGQAIVVVSLSIGLLNLYIAKRFNKNKRRAFFRGMGLGLLLIACSPSILFLLRPAN